MQFSGRSDLLDKCRFLFTPSDFCVTYMYVMCTHVLVHDTSVLASSISLHVHAFFMLRIFVHSCPLYNVSVFPKNRVLFLEGFNTMLGF